MAVTPADVIAVARAEVGYREGYSNGHWNNRQKYSPAVPGLEWSDWQAWCATFVSWCAMQAGAADLYPRTASCLTGVAWFKARGRFSEYPAIGAQVFFGSGGGTHTGLVYDYDETYIYTIEGNTNDSGSAEGNGVYLKKRGRRDTYTYGYGYPKFEGGIKSADPAYANQAPAPAVPPAAKPKPVVYVSHINAARAKDIPAATGHTTYPAEVKLVEKALVAEGFLSAQWADGSWGTKTQDAFDAFRRSIGLTGNDAKGSVGTYSLGRLAAKHGWTVKA
ncbi:CHAP domain-containing protein [Streptomyces yangpuensis]|uniref:CHAP domain-containing protein n=1 Tax=Streptomyces yangpuensis TaxID=1648182 RepID=UPI003425B1EF